MKAAQHDGVEQAADGWVHVAVLAQPGGRGRRPRPCADSSLPTRRAAPRGARGASTCTQLAGREFKLPRRHRAERASRPGRIAAAPAAAAPAAASPSAAPAGACAVNINSADASALQTLPGIGESKAAAILQDRKDNGPFATCDDLDRVSGIGPSTVANLKACCVTK